MFRKIKTVDWVSKIKLSEKRKEDIKWCCKGTKVSFNYPENLSNFNILLKNFQREDIVNFGNNLNENILWKRNSTGFTNASLRFYCIYNELSSFFAVSKKVGYICVHVFYIIFPNKWTWLKKLFVIVSQTKIFNIFPSAIQLGTMLKFLTNNSDRETIFHLDTFG